MSTPEPHVLTEACSMCPETLVAFTDTELTEQLSLHIARHHNGTPAAAATPARPTLADAARELTDVFSDLLRFQPGDIIRVLTYSEAEAIANVIYAAGHPNTAALVIYHWARNDPDWDEDNDRTETIRSWISLINDGTLDTSSSASCQHYIDTGLYLTSGETR